MRWKGDTVTPQRPNPHDSCSWKRGYGGEGESILFKLKESNKQSDNPVNEWLNEMSRQPSGDGVQMSNKHRKKCSPSSAIREMQIKTHRGVGKRGQELRVSATLAEDPSSVRPL